MGGYIWKYRVETGRLLGSLSGRRPPGPRRSRGLDTLYFYQQVEPQPVELDGDRLVSVPQPALSLEGSCGSSSSESPVSNHGSTGAHSGIGGIAGGFVSVSSNRKLPPPLHTHPPASGHLPLPQSGKSILFSFTDISPISHRFTDTLR